MRSRKKKKKVDLETCRLVYLVPSWAAITAHQPPPPPLAANMLPLPGGYTQACLVLLNGDLDQCVKIDPQRSTYSGRKLVKETPHPARNLNTYEEVNANVVTSTRISYRFLWPRNTCASLITSRHTAASPAASPPRSPMCFYHEADHVLVRNS